jgi:hypothetical protein
MSKLVLGVLLTLILGSISACGWVIDRPSGWGKGAPVSVAIDQIAESGQPGQFTLSGTAALPDSTPLTVTAVRRLASQPADLLLAEEARFSILNRATAVVQDGRWQAELSLWAPGPAGTYQEAWQTAADAPANASQVSSTVDFWATVEPRDFAQLQLQSGSDALEGQYGSLLNFTPDGDPYLRVSEARPVALPSGRAAGSAPLPTADSSLWEGRQTLSNSDRRLRGETEAAFQDSDNLPLTEQSTMR